MPCEMKEKRREEEGREGKSGGTGHGMAFEVHMLSDGCTDGWMDEWMDGWMQCRTELDEQDRLCDVTGGRAARGKWGRKEKKWGACHGTLLWISGFGVALGVKGASGF